MNLSRYWLMRYHGRPLLCSETKAISGRSRLFTEWHKLRSGMYQTIYSSHKTEVAHTLVDSDYIPLQFSMPSRDDSDDETLSSLSRLTRSSQSQDSRMSCATSEYDANSEIESMDYIVPTQQVSQFLEEEALVLRDTLWGYLEPLNRQLPRIEFRRSQKRYRIGRTDLKEVDNDYVLADPRISECLAK